MRIWLVLPCYFDSRSLNRVSREAISEISRANPEYEVQILVLDDSAGEDPSLQDLTLLSNTIIIEQPERLGHQSSIVSALRQLVLNIQENDIVVTLDADGEDKPSDIPSLIAPIVNGQANCVLAERTRRYSGAVFKLSYFVFKGLSWALADEVIRHGNFIACRAGFLRRVIFDQTFELSYSTAFLALPCDVVKRPVERGARYFGQSKMSFVALLAHGFRMLFPFHRKVISRGVIYTLILFSLSLLFISPIGHNSYGLGMYIALFCMIVSLGFGVFTAVFLILLTRRYSRPSVQQALGSAGKL